MTNDVSSVPSPSTPEQDLEALVERIKTALAPSAEARLDRPYWAEVVYSDSHERVVNRAVRTLINHCDYEGNTAYCVVSQHKYEVYPVTLLAWTRRASPKEVVNGDLMLTQFVVFLHAERYTREERGYLADCANHWYSRSSTTKKGTRVVILWLTYSPIEQTMGPAFAVLRSHEMVQA